MTQTTFTDNVLIDGSQDIEQLRIQGDTTQNDALQTWENSAGDVPGQITGDVRLALGDDLGSSVPKAMIQANRNEFLVNNPKRGIHSFGKITNLLSDLIVWVVNELELRGSAGVSGIQAALQARITHNNTGTSTSAELRAGDFLADNKKGTIGARVGQVTGIRGSAGNEAGAYLNKAVGVEGWIANAFTGNVTDAAAFEVAPPFSFGTIANLYGLRVPDLTLGASNVAIQTGLGKVSFGDFMEVKRPSVVPGTPATDFIRLYPKSDGKLYAKDWNGKEYEVTIPSIPNGRKSWQVNAVGGTAATSIAGIGIITPTVVGGTTINDTDSTYANFATTAVIGNNSGLISTTFNLVRPGHEPTFLAVIRTGSDITNLRLFVGLFATAPTNADNPPNNSICFRYSTPAADGGWRGICRDATAQTVSAQIGANLAASTKYVLKFRKQGSTVYFSVDNGAETAIATNLPAAATDLGLGVRVITTAAAIKNLKLSRLHCDFN